MPLSIIFFGSDSFARRLLQNCLEGSLKLTAIVTKEGDSKSSSRRKTKTPVKKYLDESALEISHFCPIKASSSEFIEKIKALKPDLFIVCGYGEIISQDLLDVPKLTCINVHPSALPKYRGATPIQSALINGENETAVCIMKMALKMDAGPIYKELSLEIQIDDTYESLEKKLTDLCTEPLLDLLEHFEKKGCANSVEQDESKVSFCKRIFPDDCQINWALEALTVHNLIRATSTRPGAWCMLNIRGEKKKCRVLKARLFEGDGQEAVGAIIKSEKKGSLVVQCGKGALELLQLQLEGKRVMPTKDFVNGVKNISFM
jgi:methionyl-tRNA formyltransferase